MTKIFSLIALLFCTTSLFAGNLRFEDRLDRDLSFSSSNAEKSIVVENINGFIRVETHRQDTVSLSVEKVLSAKTEERLEAAKNEVFLNISEVDNTIKLVVDGPFRGPENKRDLNLDKLGYYLKYNFVLRIPEFTNVRLKTYNDGDITVTGPIGDFKVNNINGSISLSEAHGSGSAKTINGKVRVAFADLPTVNCRFSTINGDVDLTFPDGLSADFKMETRNGEIYTAFDYEVMGAGPVKVTKKGSTTRYRIDDHSNIRIGDGGLSITMKSLNGDLKIRKL